MLRFPSSVDFLGYVCSWGLVFDLERNCFVEGGQKRKQALVYCAFGYKHAGTAGDSLHLFFQQKKQK